MNIAAIITAVTGLVAAISSLIVTIQHKNTTSQKFAQIQGVLSNTAYTLINKDIPPCPVCGHNHPFTPDKQTKHRKDPSEIDDTIEGVKK